jgi:hypothetical protein
MSNEEIVAAGFDFNRTDKPNAFIQWKGTDVCMDFYCECGAHCHFDGYFAYAVKCPHCETVYEMPSMLYPRKLNSNNVSDHVIKTLEIDIDKLVEEALSHE